MMEKEELYARIEELERELAEERILDVLIPPAKNNWGQTEQQQEPSAARQAFRKKLREGQLDDKEIEIDLAAAPMGVEIMAPPGSPCSRTWAARSKKHVS